jgi:hypothetical protein
MNLKEIKESGLESDLIQVKNFVTKIAALRASQSAYFRDHQYKDLVQSKIWEREIDASLPNITSSAAKILTIYKNIINDGIQSQTNTDNIESSANSERGNEDSFRSLGSGSQDLFSGEGEQRKVPISTGHYR